MSELGYWAVLFIKDGDGSGTVVITDGDRSPHDEETVRKIIEFNYGKPDRVSAVGPMTTKDLAEQYLRDATSTPEGLNYWHEQMK